MKTFICSYVAALLFRIAVSDSRGPNNNS